MATDLIIPVDALKPEIVFAPLVEGQAEREIDRILAGVEREVSATPIEISTARGRAACKSLAYKIVRSKTALDDMGKEYVADIKKQAALIDADRRIIRDRMDKLAAAVRKPLDEWERAEQDRIDRHETAIGEIADLGVFNTLEPTVEQIKQRIESLGVRPWRDWQEFEKRATDTAAAVLRALEVQLAFAQTREAERAELDRLRQEQEKAMKAAEAQRIAAEKQHLADIEKKAAEADLRRTEAEKSLREMQERADRIAFEQAAERQRLEDAERLAAERRRDTEHRRQINNQVRDAFVQAGFREDVATSIVRTIASGKIPHTSILY